MPADPADQVDDPRRVPFLERQVPGQIEEARVPRARDELEAPGHHIDSAPGATARAHTRAAGHTLSRMALRRTAVGLVALILLSGCGHAKSGEGTADRSIKQELLRGVDEIRTNRDPERLDARLGRVLVSLRGLRGSSARVERARQAAIVGFELTRKGVRSQIDFRENDSGNVAAATRDARRSDRYLGRGADRIRMAALAFGIQIAKLAGH